MMSEFPFPSMFGEYGDPRQTEAVEATDVLADIEKIGHDFGLDIKIPDTIKYKGTFLYVNKSLPANTVMVSEDVARSMLLDIRDKEESHGA